MTRASLGTGVLALGPTAVMWVPRDGRGRLPVADARRQLGAGGCGTSRPNKGATAGPPLAPEDIREIIETREGLEALLMDHAIEQLTDETLNRKSTRRNSSHDQ